MTCQVISQCYYPLKGHTDEDLFQTIELNVTSGFYFLNGTH